MKQPDAPRWRINIGPIRHACYGRAGCSCQPYCDGRVRREFKLAPAKNQVQGIKYHRYGPGSDGHVCENCVQRLAEPCAIEEVPDPLCSWISASIKSFVESFLQFLFDSVPGHLVRLVAAKAAISFRGCGRRW